MIHGDLAHGTLRYWTATSQKYCIKLYASSHVLQFFFIFFDTWRTDNGKDDVLLLSHYSARLECTVFYGQTQSHHCQSQWTECKRLKVNVMETIRSPLHKQTNDSWNHSQGLRSFTFGTEKFFFGLRCCCCLESKFSCKLLHAFSWHRRSLAEKCVQMDEGHQPRNYDINRNLPICLCVSIVSRDKWKMKNVSACIFDHQR